MGYRTLRNCIAELEATKQLVRIDQPIDPDLEAAEIQRRVFQAGGPAVYYASVQGCRFPMVSNLFGTMARVRFIFRDSLRSLERLVKLAVDPADMLRRPRLYFQTPWTGLVLAAQTGPQRAGARPRKPRSTSCRSSGRGRRTEGRTSRFPRFTRRIPTNPAWRMRTSGCTGSRCPGACTRRTARWGSIIRSTAGSAPTTRPRSGGRKSFG